MVDKNFNLDEFSNEELYELFYREILYYSEELYSLSKIILKQLPKKYKFRIISKLHRLNKGE